MPIHGRRALLGQLTALTLSRLVINTGLRLTYPFLPAFARGLGVPLEAVTRLLSLRSAVGLTSPLFSPISERFGRRTSLVLAMFALGLGGLLTALFPTYWPFGVTLILISVAKVIYDPAMQAFLGDAVPYQHRGKAIAVTEFAWAGALLAGAPAAGLLIQRYGWNAPFLWLGALGLGAMLLLRFAMPPGRVESSSAINLRATFRVIRQQPVIWALILYVALMMAANETLLVVYGAWLEGSFSLDLASLGLTAGIIGGAEIMGEVSVGLTVDRFGKRPVIITTGIVASLCYLLVPWVGVSLTGAMAILFLVFYFFEITVVGGIPLVTELLPQARSVVLSVALASGGIGRAAGALIGPLAWRYFDLPGVAVAAALMTAVAIFILVRWLVEGTQTTPGTWPVAGLDDSGGESEAS